MAQLVARFLHTEEVISSSLVSPTDTALRETAAHPPKQVSSPRTDVLRTALKALAIGASALIVGVLALYLLLVFGQRKAVEFHYG